MKGKARRILDVWGYYRLSTLLLLMIVLLAFAGFICASADGTRFGRGPQPKCVDEQMTLLTGRLHSRHPMGRHKFGPSWDLRMKTEADA